MAILKSEGQTETERLLAALCEKKRSRRVTALARHQADLAFIEAELASPFDRPTVVVTHHAPHAISIHPKYAATVLSAAFASDLTTVIERRCPNLWLHGHTHALPTTASAPPALSAILRATARGRREAPSTTGTSGRGSWSRCEEIRQPFAGKPVVYVPGNEFYGGEIENRLPVGKESGRRHQRHLLDHDVAVIDGVKDTAIQRARVSGVRLYDAAEYFQTTPKTLLANYGADWDLGLQIPVAEAIGNTDEWRAAHAANEERARRAERGRAARGARWDVRAAARLPAPAARRANEAGASDATALRDGAAVDGPAAAPQGAVDVRAILADATANLDAMLFARRAEGRRSKRRNRRQVRPWPLRRRPTRR
jgi:hypothetical protein